MKTHGGEYDIQMSINEKTLDFTLSGYEFTPVDAQENNKYTVQWVNEFDDLTITVAVAIELGKLPAPFETSDETVKFTLSEGVNDWVYGKSSIVEAMFAKYQKLGLIGIEDDGEAKTFFSDVLAGTEVTLSKLNGKEGALMDPQNIDTPMSSFDPIKLGLHSSQIVKEQKQTYNVEQTDPYTGTIFKFDLKGDVVLPTDVLAYSTVDYVNYDATEERWEVEVDGDIVDNKYTIDQADLGKYFYVNDQANYGVKRDLKVRFDINTNDAPKPDSTNIVNVYEDATSHINVLEAGKSVIKDWTNGGLFGENEIKVTATLIANGFPVDVKTVTLFTKDPLEFGKSNDIVVERVPGKDAIAYTHSVLTLTETISDGIGGNLLYTESYPSQLFTKSHADVIYGAKFIGQENPEYNCTLVRVYTETADGEKVTYPGSKYLFNNGKITLIADDGLLNQPIIAEVEYTLTHDYNYGKDQKVTVKVTFVPNNNL